MPAVSRIKTYSKAKNNVHSYSSSSQNSFLFPITGASTAIDSLLAKNIEKRNSSTKEDDDDENQTTRSEKNQSKQPRLLQDDSFDLKINTTFENLLQAPDLHPVNYCNISLITGKNSSTDNSNPKPEVKQKTYERKVKKTTALSSGKSLKNKEKTKKNLLQLAKQVQKTPEIVKKVSPVARKFTPIASTSQLKTYIPKNNAIFQPGLRHCMQAQNSPNYLAASTPLIPRHVAASSREDFSLSPITARKNIFKCKWESLFESEKSETNSLPSTSNCCKDNVSNVILINSTIYNNIPNINEEKSILRNNSLVKNDVKFNAIPIVIIQDNVNDHKNPEQKNNEYELAQNMYSAKVDLTRHSFSKYIKKSSQLVGSPYIDLTRYSFSEYLINKQTKSQIDNSRHSADVSSIKMQDDSIKNTSNIKMKLRSRFQSEDTKSRTKYRKNGSKTSLKTGSKNRSKTLSVKNKSDLDNKKTKTKKIVDKARGIGLRTRSHKNVDDDEHVEAPTRKARTMFTKPKLKADIFKELIKRRLRSNSIHLDKTTSSSESNLQDSVFETTDSDKTKTVFRKRSNTYSFCKSNNSTNPSLNNEEKINPEVDEAVHIANFIEQLKKPTTSICNLNNSTNRSSNIEENLNSQEDESVYISEYINQIKKHSPNTNTNSKKDVVSPIRRSSRTRKKSVLIDEENYSDWGEFKRISQNKTKETPENISSDSVFNSTPNPKRRTRSNSCLIIDESNTVINISDLSEKSLFSSNSMDVIENTINTTIKSPKKFVTTRRGSSKELKNNFVTRRRGTSKEIENHEIDQLNHQTTSLQEWEKFSQKNITTIKIDDVAIDKKESPPINKLIENNSVISDTFDEDICNQIFLKPGKKWFRSLSILRRTNIHDINLNNSNKGRKWRDSVCTVFDQQEKSGGVLFDTSDNQHNEIYNITKNLPISRINSLSRRTTLQIVPIAVVQRDISVCRNAVSILEEPEIVSNKSGYVSTLADESQSILASFDKLSLTTNVEEREETARQIILKRCGQTTPLLFDDCYSKRLLTRCRKIGEGVYGEVFMYKSLDRQCRVMKIIPIEGDQVVNGEHQKKFEEIISEIIIASELSNLRNNKEFSTNGFNELLKICCVQGKYPQHLLDLWNLYDEEQGSENDSPEIFTDEQLYIVLELANGGQDLEAFRFNNAEQSFAVFAQVVCSLAVAESALQFEHRDMHWGNLLISETNETTCSFRLNGRELEIATKGVNVSIIDFTLSRMTYNKCCIFNDLALDPDLFTATGDYQFDIYRLMRQRNKDDWQRFEPYSNILWLDYTLEKMITQLRYLRTNTKTHKTNIRRLTQMRKKIFNYNSATELLNSDAFSQVFLY